MRQIGVLLALISLVQLYAQDKDLKKEILSYQDSTKVLIQNSRRLILEAIKNKDFSKADAIKDYVENEVDRNQYAVFTLGEDFLISYFTSDFSRILEVLKNWETIESSPYNIYPVDQDQLFANLIKEAVENEEYLMSNIYDIVNNEEQSGVLVITLKSLISIDPEAAITQQMLNEMVEDYISTYEVSPYHYFLKSAIRVKYEDKWGYTVYIGASFPTLTDGLGDYIDPFTNALLGMEFYFKRRYFAGFRMQGGGAETTQDFSFKGDWPAEMRVNPLYLGANFGYVLVDSKKVRFAGMIELGGLSITPVEDEKNDQTKDLKLASFTYGSSILLDYYPFSSQGFIGETRFGLRFQAGYMVHNLGNKDPRFDGTAPYVGVALVLDLFEKTLIKD